MESVDGKFGEDLESVSVNVVDIWKVGVKIFWGDLEVLVGICFCGGHF